MRVFRRILHPTDFSRASRTALDKAVELARQNAAEVLLVHVVVPPAPMVAGEGYVSARTYEVLESEARRSAERQLAKLVAKVEPAKVRVATMLLYGIPYERIVATARAKRADLIVMGTHGRTGLSKLFLGSVAGRVVQLAPCPVLTVRGR